MTTAKLAEPMFGNAADEQWGYEFGIDGIMSLDKASEWLGSASRSTLDRLTTDRLIRKGERRGSVVFCTRSVKNYAKSIEK
jgi:hypothetical protein